MEKTHDYCSIVRNNEHTVYNRQYKAILYLHNGYIITYFVHI